MKTTVSNQQVHIAVQQYIQYTILCSHVATNYVLQAESVDTCCVCLKKNQTTPRPSEHPPVMGEKMSKRLGGIKRLQIQNHYMAFKQVPRCR